MARPPRPPSMSHLETSRFLRGRSHAGYYADDEDSDLGDYTSRSRSCLGRYCSAFRRCQSPLVALLALFLFGVICLTSSALVIPDAADSLKAFQSRINRFCESQNYRQSGLIPKTLGTKLSQEGGTDALGGEGQLQEEEEEECDPFASPGQLVTDVADADKNYWKPWDAQCHVSSFFTAMRRGEHMPWLFGKTIAVIGDSIDRDHVEYFCELAEGNMEWIWEDTRYSPVYTYSDDDPRDYDPEANGHASGGASQSRPRICTIEKYDFAVVFVFHYGLLDGKEERDMPHYYPPYRFIDRLDNILVPILKAAQRYPPTLVEFSTGSWDLQRWTFEDREAEADRLAPLSTTRAALYETRFREALRAVHHAFSEPRTGLVLREMQHTMLVDTVPPPRVHALKDMQEYILSTEVVRDGRKWDIDRTADLLLGQEHTYRDAIHPNILPAGKLWADVILRKLRVHVGDS